MDLVGKKEFVVVTFGSEDETFIVYMTIPASSSSNVHSFCLAQIVSLTTDKVPTAIPNKYADFANDFLPDLATELLEHIKINNLTINSIDGKQPSYRSIYGLRLLKLEILKTFIEINLANGFIRSFKSSIGAPILFIKKLDSSFRLYIDYQGLDNLTI